jgi:hypothetical protein
MSAAAAFWAGLSGDPRVRWRVKPADPLLRGVQPVYLATPYSRRAAPDGVFDLALADAAAADAARVLRIMTQAEISAIAPIAQAHLVIRDLWADADGAEGRARVGAYALDAGVWARWCRPLLHACRGVHVPAIVGWCESDGIRFEVADALARNVPVFVQGGPVP